MAAALAAWHHSAAEGALRGDGVVCEDDTHNFEQLAASLAQHRALVDNVGLYHTDGLRGLKVDRHTTQHAGFVCSTMSAT